MTARHIIADAPTYAVPMRPLEYRALAWDRRPLPVRADALRRRHLSAVRLDGPRDRRRRLPPCAPSGQILNPESGIRIPDPRSREAGNGNPWQTVPPCAGGPLADALLSLTACAYDHGAPGTVPTDEERWALADLPRCEYCAADHDPDTCPNAPEEDDDR